MPETDEDERNAVRPPVSLADFPTYDGVSSPEDFIAQCRRLGQLGGFSEERLGQIVAARCSGEALRVVNELESLCNGNLTLTAVSDELSAHFSTHCRAEQAAIQLTRIRKGEERARQYGMTVRRLVRLACPHFFNDNGQIKSICKPSYDAALYRHFVAGLDEAEVTLLSRLKVATFEEAIDELTREESLPNAGQPAREASQARVPPRSVNWACPVSREPSPSDQGRASPQAGRENESSYRRDAGGHRPDRRPSPGGGYDSYERQQWRNQRDGSPAPARRRGRSPSPGGSRGNYGQQWRRQPWRGSSPRDQRPPGAWGRHAPPRGGSVYDDDETRFGGPPDPDSNHGMVRCWSCRGWGHLKRECPNGQAGRRAMWD